MSEQAGIPGELIYEYVCQFTQVVEYGVSAEGVFSGQTPPPAEGARIDVYFEGPVTGKLKGTVKGVDYLHIRADGRCQLFLRVIEFLYQPLIAARFLQRR